LINDSIGNAYKLINFHSFMKKIIKTIVTPKKDSKNKTKICFK